MVDNQSAINLAKNAEYHKRSKHIDVRFHFIRDVVNQNKICIQYVKSKDQKADILRKALPKQQFCYLRNLINVTDFSK